MMNIKNRQEISDIISKELEIKPEPKPSFCVAWGRTISKHLPYCMSRVCLAALKFFDKDVGSAEAHQLAKENLLKQKVRQVVKNELTESTQVELANKTSDVAQILAQYLPVEDINTQIISQYLPPYKSSKTLEAIINALGNKTDDDSYIKYFLTHYVEPSDLTTVESLKIGLRDCSLFLHNSFPNIKELKQEHNGLIITSIRGRNASALPVITPRFIGYNLPLQGEQLLQKIFIWFNLQSLQEVTVEFPRDLPIKVPEANPEVLAACILGLFAVMMKEMPKNTFRNFHFLGLENLCRAV